MNYGELNRLKGKIRERGETYRTLSAKAGIPLNSLSNKLNGHYLFNFYEARRICSVLEIPPECVFSYFCAET